MSRSRNRKRPNRHAPRAGLTPPSEPGHGRIALEALFDKANRHGSRIKGPRVLYHYTSWSAAEAIIASQQFRATAHDCTNDPAEFATADATIIELARDALARARGPATRSTLRLFLDHYDEFRIGAYRRAYLVCFSAKRDDPHQWCRYGRRGEGVCLGLRLLNTESPKIAGVSTAIMPVTYGTETELRHSLESWFDIFVDTFDRAQDNEHNWRLGSDALDTSAAAWALATKHEEWAPEHEVRMIFLTREGSQIVPIDELRPDGTLKRYFNARVTNRRRMPVHELLIGPNQDIGAGLEHARQMFSAARYRFPERKGRGSTAHLRCDAD